MVETKWNSESCVAAFHATRRPILGKWGPTYPENGDRKMGTDLFIGMGLILQPVARPRPRFRFHLLSTVLDHSQLKM